LDKIAAERAWIKSPHFLGVTAAVSYTGKNSENLRHARVCTPLYPHIYIYTLTHTPGDTEVCFSESEFHLSVSCADVSKNVIQE